MRDIFTLFLHALVVFLANSKLGRNAAVFVCKMAQHNQWESSFWTVRVSPAAASSRDLRRRDPSADSDVLLRYSARDIRLDIPCRATYATNN
jgi:hypothetical protein